MDIYLHSYYHRQAVYKFVVNKECRIWLRVTKMIRKGQCPGYDCSTTMSVDAGRKFVRQLQKTK
jgi:hypothetical protein